MKKVLARAGKTALACTLAVSLCGCSALSALSVDGEDTGGSVWTTGETGSRDMACASSTSYYDEYEYGGFAFNTEEYNAQDENGFVSVVANPFSTFSADVDTASYCNLRRMITEGYTLEDIPAGAVRTEEMLNYFTYNYAEPTDDQLFGVTATIGDCPWNSDTKLLVMGLQTASASYEQTESAGNNLVFLIDVSGSMADSSKLPLLQESFSYLLDNLNPTDTISIVTYSGEERVVCAGVPASNRLQLLWALNSLEAGGCTNGEAGITMAYDLAEQYFIEGGVNRIILASDGDLNVGATSESDLASLVEEKRDSGVYLSVLGFGAGNYKDNKMETLADQGNGAYYYIDCEAEAQRVFGEDLCATIVPVAKDVKLQVEFNPAYVKGYRLIGYENRALEDEDFTDASVDAGEVGAGQSVTVAYELVMNDSDYAMGSVESKYGNTTSQGVENGEWLTLNWNYQSVDGTSKVSQGSYAVTQSAYKALPNADWRFAAQVIQLGMLANDSSYAGTTTLAGLDEELYQANYSDERRAEFADLVHALAAEDEPFVLFDTKEVG